MATFDQVYNFIAKNRFSGDINKMNRDLDRFSAKILKARREQKLLSQNTLQLGRDIRSTGLKMSTFLSIPIVLAGRSMVNAASDAVETRNKFNQVFSDVQQKSSQVSRSFSKDFGVANSTAQRIIGTTGDLLVGFGFAGDKALELSRRTAELGADLASFQNIQGGAEDASFRLTKALLGETESAKMLGIVIRQDSQEFKNLMKHFQRTQGATLQQAKAMAVLEIATKQSQKAIGDVSRTWEDYASVQRRAQQSTIALKESWGRLLIPMALELNKVLISVSEGLQTLPKWVQKTIVFGLALLAILGPIIIVLGQMIIATVAIAKAFGALFVIMKGVGLVIAGIFGLIKIIGIVIGIGLAPIIGVIGAIIAAIGILILKWEKVKSFFGFGGEMDDINTTIENVNKSEVKGSIDVNINAPKDTVKSVKTKRKRGPLLNTGVNMAPAI